MRLFVGIGMFAILMPLVVLTGCVSSSHEGFAIYLPAEDVKASQVTSVTDLRPSSEPLISVKDIVSYARDTHEIELTPQAYSELDRIVGAAKVPTWGKVFIVCVDRQPVYWGAFWPMYSSQSFDGIIIPTPLGIMGNANSIEIGAGYPSSGFYKGQDPRSDPAIMKSLQDAGKLK